MTPLVRVLVGLAFAPLLAAACASATTQTRWEEATPAPRVGPTPPHTARPAAPAAVNSSDSARVPLVVDGKDVSDAGLVAVRALELACLPAVEALTEPTKARARLDAAAGKQGVTLGPLSFVVLQRDPARSIVDPPPHLCRAIVAGTRLRAPLVRIVEPAARWLVRRIGTGLVDDARALAAQSDTKKLAATAAPRVLVDDAGALVAIAVPVGATPGGT